jgi:hypothetical protein
MSNIAPPLPKLLKEVNHGKGQYTKRLENKDRLLRWAINYMHVAVGDLIVCNRDPSGRIADPETKVEIQRCQKFLKMARAATSHAKGAQP